MINRKSVSWHHCWWPWATFKAYSIGSRFSNLWNYYAQGAS